MEKRGIFSVTPISGFMPPACGPQASVTPPPPTSRRRRRGLALTACAIEQLESRTLLSNTIYDPTVAGACGENPAGQFGFGREGRVGSSFVLNVQGTNVYDSNANPLLYAWEDSPNEVPVVAVNVSTQPCASPYSGDMVPPDCVLMQPDNAGSFAVTRFTAPATGQYVINAAFFGIDGNYNGTDVHIFVDGSSIFDGDVTNATVTAPTETLNLSANDTVDFAVGASNGLWCCYDSTALSLSIANNDFNVQMEPIYAYPGQAITAPIAQFTTNDPNIDPDNITADVSLDGPATTTIVNFGSGHGEVDLTCTPTDDAIYAGNPVDYGLSIGYQGQTAYTSDNLPLYVTSQDSPPGTLNGSSPTFEMGSSLSATLGDFTDSNNTANDPSVYGVQTDWGDGTVTWTGSVSSNPDSPGDFFVNDAHTYSALGTYSATVTVYGNDGVWTGTASVDVIGNPIPISLSTSDISASDQTPFGGMIATFTTSDPGATASDFTVGLDWDDGSAPDVALVMPNSNGGFDIDGTHSYAAGGVYYPTIEVDSNGADSGDGGFVATVTDPNLSVTANTIAVTSGSSGTYTVATLYDANVAYWSTIAASVNFEDGSDPVAGTVVVNDGLYVTAPYTATTTENLAPEVTVTDGAGSAYVADPPLVVNIDTSAEAVEAQVFTLGLSASGVNAGNIASWIVTWGDGAVTSDIPGNSTSVTHTYDNDPQSVVTAAAISATALDSVDGNQTAYADPLAIAPAAPTGLTAAWDNDPVDGLCLNLAWTNNSSLATGFEIDELSGDGQNYSTVDTLPACSKGDSMGDTIRFPDFDPEATYSVYATSDGGTNYSDPATAGPGIFPPSLSVVTGSVTDTSLTLAYTDPSQAAITLYWQQPGDLNLHAYDATLDTSGADDTIEIDGLVPGATYSFELDAYSASHDIHSAVVSQTLPACADQPTIISAVGDGDGGQITGNVAITFTTTSSAYANEYSRYNTYLILNRDDDPYHLFYQSTDSNCDFADGQGGAIPALDVTRTDMTNGVGTYVADFPVFASNQNVTFQILLQPEYADAIPPSVPVGAAVGDNSGSWDYPIPTAPILTGSTDPTTGDLDIAYTTLLSSSCSQESSEGDETLFPAFFAIVDNMAEQIAPPNWQGGTYAMGNYTFVVSADSEYAGDPIFAAYLENLVDPYRDGNPYWSGYSNFVNNDGASSDRSGAAAPSGLTATLIDANDEFLHWIDNSDNEDTFEIDALNPADAQYPNDPSSWVPVATGIPSDSTDYTVTKDQVVAALGDGATLPGQMLRVTGDDAPGCSPNLLSTPAAAQQRVARAATPAIAVSNCGRSWLGSVAEFVTDAIDPATRGAFWSGALEGAHDGLYAWVNGFVPFIDPISRSHFYDPYDSTLKISGALGQVSRDAWVAAAIPNIGTWFRNPVLYEIGQKTLEDSVYQALSHLSPIERGAQIVSDLGWMRAILPGLTGYGNTIFTGLTPGGYLALLTGLTCLDNYIKSHSTPAPAAPSFTPTTQPGTHVSNVQFYMIDTGDGTGPHPYRAIAEPAGRIRVVGAFAAP